MFWRECFATSVKYKKHLQSNVVLCWFKIRTLLFFSFLFSRSFFLFFPFHLSHPAFQYWIVPVTSEGTERKHKRVWSLTDLVRAPLFTVSLLQCPCYIPGFPAHRHSPCPSQALCTRKDPIPAARVWKTVGQEMWSQYFRAALNFVAGHGPVAGAEEQCPALL